MRGDYAERTRRAEKSRRVMLYVHGGAYFFGGVDEHRYQMQRHARKLRARVFAPRYRLAPQFPFPCGLHDCLAAYLYLLTVQEPEEIILAGDSAGAGMLVSMLVVLRDQGLPLPAGAVLISPWVDLTHSFPSVADGSDLDYIPAYGFMQKPSPAWPPSNEDELKQIARGHSTPEGIPRKTRRIGRREAKAELEAEADAVHELEMRRQSEIDAKPPKESTEESDSKILASDIVPDPEMNLSIHIDGKQITLKDQIQLYTTNELVSHPLVSPILQPSLGGLPPLLILTGGGEVLRDEQIYLAHKAANPGKYPLHSRYQARYDPTNKILDKHKPTNVQVQVWDDLCHAAPTLSFTRPAKFMYRSIAQFGAWALARAQQRSIEITDDDDVSVISSGSDTDSSSALDVGIPHLRNAEATARVSKAGDPLPPFKNHMIRQCVTRHGVIYPMAPASEMPALQMPAADLGVMKPGPVRKWLAARKEWDTRYAAEKRRVQKKRMKEMIGGEYESCEEGEKPPPSALVGRRKKGDEGASGEERNKQKKNWGISLWSLWGSKHDESTIRREEEMVDTVKRDGQDVDGVVEDRDLSAKDNGTRSGRPRVTSTGSRARTRRKSSIKSSSSGGGGGGGGGEATVQSRSRTRTVTVSDQGQTDGHLAALRREHQAPSSPPARLPTSPSSTPNPFLSPTYLPKSNHQPPNPPTHLRVPNSNTASISPSTLGVGAGSPDNDSLRNASTTAIFSAPGVIRADPEVDGTNRDGEGAEEDDDDEEEEGGGGDFPTTTPIPHRTRYAGTSYATPPPPPSTPRVTTRSPSCSRPDTPLSTSSKDRLWASNHSPLSPSSVPRDGGSLAGEGQYRASRNPSTVAVVGVEGVVGVIGGGGAEVRGGGLMMGWWVSGCVWVCD